MTEPADAALRRLAELIAGITETLRGGDATRATAAAQVDALRELLGQVTGPTRDLGAAAAGVAALFDVAQVSEALRLFADWLRSPTADREAGAERAMSDLQAALGPVLGGALVRAAAPDDATGPDHYRQQARSALDDYFREHPIKPTKP